MNTYTTIEESKQLIEAGLDVNTADMYYEEVYLNKNDEPCYITPPKIGKSKFIAPKQNLPCWSLAALLDLLPNIIVVKNIYGDSIECELRIHPLDHNAIYYIEPDGTPFCYHKGDPLFTNIIEMLKWTYSIKI